MKEKIQYYKQLCKTIVHLKNNQLNIKIEEINEILFTNRLTKGIKIFSSENLDNHKGLIHDLLNLNSEKREEIYLIEAQKEILEKELKFWVYDFDKIKLSTELRVNL